MSWSRSTIASPRSSRASTTSATSRTIPGVTVPGDGWWCRPLPTTVYWFAPSWATTLLVIELPSISVVIVVVFLSRLGGDVAQDDGGSEGLAQAVAIVEIAHRRPL